MNLFFLLATILVVGTVADDSSQLNCELGPDGTCLETAKPQKMKINMQPRLRISDIDQTNCVNGHERCDEWAEAGECTVNPFYMLVTCKKACNICERLRTDESGNTFMGIFYGVNQTIINDQDKEKIQESDLYMEQQLFNETMKQTMAVCRNENKDCTHWAARGECEKLPGYMNIHCAPACQSCHLLDINQRCPFDPNEPGALESGGLDLLFRRISEEYQGVTVHSSPKETFQGRPAPWIITLDDFLSEEEAKRIIELGYEFTFARSSDVGKIKADGSVEGKISSNRTSETTWCTQKCHTDPVITAVEERLEKLLQIPIGNAEYLQILKYEPNQFYGYHHDYIAFHRGRSCGVRILTAYLYLNDVEAGGGTQFTDMNLVVMPKRGRLLLWPSVLDDQPQSRDGATHHEALPVEQGIKYGVNAWVHYRNFRYVYQVHCSALFQPFLFFSLNFAVNHMRWVAPNHFTNPLETIDTKNSLLDIF